MAARGGQRGWRDGLLVVAAGAIVLGLTAIGSAIMPVAMTREPGVVDPAPVEIVASLDDIPVRLSPRHPGGGVSAPLSRSTAPTRAPRLERPTPDTSPAVISASPSGLQNQAERQTFLEGNATLARRRLWPRPSQAASPGQELQMIAASSGRKATPGADVAR